MELHFASGNAIYNIGVETGNLIEPSESHTHKEIEGHNPESTITSLRVFYPCIKDAGDSSSSRTTHIITTGSDSKIIFWEQVAFQYFVISLSS